MCFQTICKPKTPKIIAKRARYIEVIFHLLPVMAEELIHGSCVLSIHQRRNPVTPNPPAWYAIWEIKQENEYSCGKGENLRTPRENEDLWI